MHDLLRRYEEQIRTHPAYPAVERAEHVIRHVGTTWRGVLWTDLDESNADEVIAREVERFDGLGRWEWKLYSHDLPGDLADRLRAAGFEPEETETMLIAPIAGLPLDSSLPEGVELRAIEDEAGIDAFLEVQRVVFEHANPAWGAELLGDIRAGRTKAVVALAGDRPISAGRIELYPGTEFASLYGGGTVPDWRRRGIFRAVVAHRAALAAMDGYRYLQVDASDDSRPILERLGFIPLGTTTPFIHA